MTWIDSDLHGLTHCIMSFWKRIHVVHLCLNTTMLKKDIATKRNATISVLKKKRFGECEAVTITFPLRETSHSNTFWAASFCWADIRFCCLWHLLKRKAEDSFAHWWTVTGCKLIPAVTVVNSFMYWYSLTVAKDKSVACLPSCGHLGSKRPL